MVKHLILVTVDAWRADFQGRSLLPCLERSPWREQIFRFERAYSNGPWTTPGLLSLFTGLSPQGHGVNGAWSLRPEGGAALAHSFQEAGIACPNLCYLNQVENYFNLGYRPEESPGYPKNPLDDQLERAILNLSTPSFLWYHYKFLHLPYWASPEARAAFDLEGVPERLQESVGGRFVLPLGEGNLRPEDQPLIRRMYAAGLWDLNRWLSRLLQLLEKRGLAEETCLVLTADHGEELMERGHVGHASTSHRAQLYEELLRIPLLILDPRIKGPQVSNFRVQGLDLFPSLLKLMGVEPPENEGLDLSGHILGARAPGPENRPFLFHSLRRGYQTPPEEQDQQIQGFSDGRFKYLEEHYAEARALLFDLEQDPEERCPIQDPTALARYERRLKSLLEAVF